MVLKTLLLLISVSFFFLTNIILGGRDPIGLFVLRFFTLFISCLSLTVFFIKTPRFQEILGKIFVNKIIIIVFSIGFIFFLTTGFLLHGEDGDYVISTALDPIAYFIQAKIFSTGHLNVPSHELKDFFATGFFINDGKYYSTFFPGWPSILSIGIVLRTPWVINPLLGFLTLLIIYLIGKEIYDRETGLFAAVLLLFSHYFYILTPEYMSEPSALLFSSIFFYLIIKTLKEPKILTSSLSGISLGIAFLIRPFSALAISLPIMSYFFFFSLMEKKKTLITFAVFVLTFLPALFIFLMYNYFQTGSMFLTPIEYYNKFNILGFGLRSADVILNVKQYTLFDGLKNLSINLLLLNWESVLFLFIFLFFVLINKKNKWDIILFATVLSTIFLHLFYYGRHIRYYYISFFALFLLTARGINLSEISLTKIFPHKSFGNLNYFLLSFIVISNIFIITNHPKVLQRYESYRQLRNPFCIVKEKKLRNSVIFLRTVPERYNNITYYVQNPLNFNGDALLVKDLKERNKELMEYYPKKEFYIYDFDRKSKSGKLTKINKN
jgi:hypothetical protein